MRKKENAIVIIGVCVSLAVFGYFKFEESEYKKLNSRIISYYKENITDYIYNIIDGINLDISNIQSNREVVDTTESFSTKVWGNADDDAPPYDTGLTSSSSVTYKSTICEYNMDLNIKNNTGYKLQYLRPITMESTIPSFTLENGESVATKYDDYLNKFNINEDLVDGKRIDEETHLPATFTFTIKSKNGDRIDVTYNTAKKGYYFEELFIKSESGEYKAHEIDKDTFFDKNIEFHFERNKPNLNEFKFNNYEKYLLKKYENDFLSTKYWSIDGEFYGIGENIFSKINWDDEFYFREE